MILSGGLSYDTVGRRPCLTVMHGKSTAVLEMDYPIVEFLTLCETPYSNGNPSPLRFFARRALWLFDAVWGQNPNPTPLLGRLPGAVCCGGPAGEGPGGD